MLSVKGLIETAEFSANFKSEPGAVANPAKRRNAETNNLTNIAVFLLILLRKIVIANVPFLARRESNSNAQPRSTWEIFTYSTVSPLKFT